MDPVVSDTHADNSQPLLSVSNLAVDFQIRDSVIHPVRDVSFAIHPAQTLALVGESGSGKSVTAQAIMGILPSSARITGGQILFTPPGQSDNPVDLAGLDQESDAYRKIRGGQISIIFQEPMTSLSPVHPIGAQVCEALELHRDATHKEALELTTAMLGHVGFPDPQAAMKMYPFELSGGLRQRAMIAMAMICRPALLIADEPTTALDVTVQARILKMIKELQQELNMALLLITHDLGVVANMADDVVVMYHGEVMESGSLRQLFNQPEHPYLQALMHAVPRFDLEPGERLVPVREIEMHSQLLKSHKHKWSDEEKDQPILQVSQLSKTFALKQQKWFSSEAVQLKAVNNVSFAVQPGECFGIVGESGCGKTTLSKLIMRALKPDTGQITFNDHGELLDVLALDEQALFELRRKIQFIFQDPFSSLNPRMSVFDILREPLIVHKQQDYTAQCNVAEDLMQIVGLDPRLLNRYPHSFSGGQRQRIGIARALALHPDILICDEPVSALDVSVQAQVLNLLKDLQQQLGLTYIFISHNLAVVHYICDRIAVMCKGRLVEQATKQELFDNPIHPYTRSLLKAVPHPELSQPLDFAAILDQSVSHPEAWPSPFTIRDDSAMQYLEVADEHTVLVNAGADLSEVAA